MKHCVSVAVDKDNYPVLSAAGVNISGLVNDPLAKKPAASKGK
ncbi:type II toxin-antitoxin system CcdA family antitoxin [Pectobacterium sp. CHL-2024]